jgi:type II secretory pathway pseudopilin PulG
MELLIAALVVTVLASVAIPVYFVSSSRTKLAAADKSLNAVRLSLRQYYAENGSYPLQRKFVEVRSLPINIAVDKLQTDHYSISNFTYTSWDGRSYVIRLTGEDENEWLRRQLTNTGIYSNF